MMPPRSDPGSTVNAAKPEECAAFRTADQGACSGDRPAAGAAPISDAATAAPPPEACGGEQLATTELEVEFGVPCGHGGEVAPRWLEKPTRTAAKQYDGKALRLHRKLGVSIDFNRPMRP